MARMAERKKVLHRRSRKHGPASTLRLLAKDGQQEVLVTGYAGGQALPVFSGEGEAEMFVWLGGAFEDGWRIREVTAGELVSILYGPCADVVWVTLDPSPHMTPETIRLDGVSRERFVSWLLDGPRSYSPRTGAQGLVGPA